LYILNVKIFLLNKTLCDDGGASILEDNGDMVGSVEAKTLAWC